MTTEQSVWHRWDEANSKFWSGPTRVLLGLICGALTIGWMVTGVRAFLTVSIILIAVATPLLLRADFRWAVGGRAGTGSEGPDSQ